MKHVILDQYFIFCLHRAALETRDICLRGNQKLTSREDRVRRVGHFSTCLRRQLALNKPNVLEENKSRYFYNSMRNSVDKGGGIDLVNFMFDKTTWYDVLQLEQKKYGTQPFHVRCSPFEVCEKTIIDNGVSYRIIDMADITSWIEQAKTSTISDYALPIEFGLKELGDLVQQTQNTLNGVIAINRESEQVVQDLVQILEEVENG